MLNKKGLTLIEVIISISMLGIIIITIYPMFTVSLKADKLAEKDVESTIEITSLVENTIENSKSINDISNPYSTNNYNIVITNEKKKIADYSIERKVYKLNIKATNKNDSNDIITYYYYKSFSFEEDDYK